MRFYKKMLAMMLAFLVLFSVSSLAYAAQPGDTVDATFTFNAYGIQGSASVDNGATINTVTGGGFANSAVVGVGFAAVGTEPADGSITVNVTLPDTAVEGDTFTVTLDAQEAQMNTQTNELELVSAVQTYVITIDAAPTPTPTATTSSTTKPSTSTDVVVDVVVTTPTVAPTAVPTAAPTVAPTATPTAEPTVEPTAKPTTEPTVEPTAVPTVAPTTEPTVATDEGCDCWFCLFKLFNKDCCSAADGSCNCCPWCWLIPLLIVIGLVVLGIILWKRWKKKQEENLDDTPMVDHDDL